MTNGLRTMFFEKRVYVHEVDEPVFAHLRFGAIPSSISISNAPMSPREAGTDTVTEPALGYPSPFLSAASLLFMIGIIVGLFYTIIKGTLHFDY